MLSIDRADLRPQIDALSFERLAVVDRSSDAATGLYISAGWGPNPRDGLMTGLVALGIPVGVARTAIEVTVLGIGWALGGSVGVGTLLFAVSIGPLVHRALPRLALPGA